MKNIFKIVLIFCLPIVVITACGSGGSGVVGSGGSTLKSINVTPASPIIAKGASQPLSAIGTYSNGATRDITTSVLWSSSTTTVATISNLSGQKGVVAAIAPGTATIRATDSATNVSGSSIITVTSASVQMGGAIQGNPLNLSATVSTFAGTALSNGSTDGTGTAARFFNPAGITTDGTNLYIAEAQNSTIRKIVISSAIVTTMSGTIGTTGSADGTGIAALFNHPYGITTDGTNLYVADTNNKTIRKIVISTGVVTTLAGNASAPADATDGTGTAARFSTPQGITTDGTNLYVTDFFNMIIRKIVITSGVVTTIAGTALSQGSSDGTGAAALFNYPYGITTDGNNLYVTEYGNHTIRKIVISSGAVTTLAGTALSQGSSDGTGAAARFSFPRGITTDGANLYVIDGFNQTIRKVVISSGVVTTLAGTVGSMGSTDGIGVAAKFFDPENITTDGTNLYVSDLNNNTIRKIQ